MGRKEEERADDKGREGGKGSEKRDALTRGGGNVIIRKRGVNAITKVGRRKRERQEERELISTKRRREGAKSNPVSELLMGVYYNLGIL